MGLARRALLIEMLILNDFLVLRVTEVLDGTVLTLLSLKSNEGSDGSYKFVSFIFAQLVDLFVKRRHFLKLASSDQATSFLENS